MAATHIIKNTLLNLKQDHFENINYTKWLFSSLLLIVLFAFLEVALFRFSMQFVIYENWASWYFPVGLRIVALFIFPFRYWPALIIAGALGQATYFIIFFERPLGAVQATFLGLLKAYNILALLVISFFKKKLCEITISKLKPLLFILAAAILYRLIRSTLLITLSKSTGKFYGSIPDERKFELVLTHFLGGFVGIVTLIPLGFLLHKAWQYRHQIIWIEVVKAINFTFAMLTLVIGLYLVQPHTLYLLRILAILPLIWFAYRFGWAGAIFMLLVINGMIMFNIFGENQADILIENQLYVISYALTGMLLGALMNEQQKVHQDLDIKNQQLTQKNKELHILSSKNQSLAQSLVNIVEEERKHLSQELHDEVGQSITALRTELKVLEHTLKDAAPKQNFIRLDTVSMQIYDSIYSVLSWLRPRVLDDLGLTECLNGHYFKEKLSNAGIAYHSKLNGNLNNISDKLSITVFRICQECITNCIRHAQAQNLYLTINQSDGWLQLTITDDGIGINQTAKHTSTGGFGLKGIEERIDSLNGQFNISNTETGSAISINLPLS